MPISTLLVTLTLFAQAEPGADARSTIQIVSKKTSNEPAPTQNVAWATTPAQPTRNALATRETPRPSAQIVPVAAPRRVDLDIPVPIARTPDVDLVSQPPSDGPKLVPWLTLGGSAVAAVLGAVFASKAMTAVDELGELEAVVKGTTVSLPDEFKDQQKAVFTNGLAATLLLSSAVAGAIASTVVLTAD